MPAASTIAFTDAPSADVALHGRVRRSPPAMALRRVAVDVDAYDPRALLCESPRDARAVARARAGDDGASCLRVACAIVP